MPPRRRPTAPGPRPPKPAPAVYYALVVPGLESLASAELTEAGATVRETISRIDKRDGIVVFNAPDLAPVLRCGLLEDVFQIIFDALHAFITRQNVSIHRRDQITGR